MFAKLLDNSCHKSPAKVQENAANEFSALVSNGPLRIRRASEPISESKHVILGVASYSPLELELLDEIIANVNRWQGTFAVYVFDVAQCKSTTDLEQLLPGSQSVDQTPVVRICSGSGRAKVTSGLRATSDLLRETGILSSA